MGGVEYGGKMKLERKKKKLLLGKTTLRLLAPRQLTAVVGADLGFAHDGDADIDSCRCGVDDPTISQLHC